MNTAFENCHSLKGITIAFYDKTEKKNKLFSELFSFTNSETHQQRPQVLKRTFVYIPKDKNGLENIYVNICNSDFSWKKYDSLFTNKISSFSKTNVALFRLLKPDELSEDAKKMYQTFLSLNCSQFIEHYAKTDNLEMLMQFGKMGLINRDNIEDLIITAQLSGSNNTLLYLVSYKYKKIDNR